MKRKTQKSKQKNQHPFRLRFLTLVMLFVLFSTSVINGYYIYNVFGKEVATDNSKHNNMTQEQIEVQKLREDFEEENDSCKISYTPITQEQTADMIIAGDSDAYDVLLSIQGDLGIYEAEEEYRCTDTHSNDYYDIYTMQQFYNNIEVYGYQLKMTVDKSGNLLAINGSHAQLDGFDTSVVLSESDAYDYAVKYMKNKYQISADDVSIDGLGEKIFFDDNDEPVVGYLFEVDKNLPLMHIVVDANTGEVIFEQKLFKEAMVKKTLQGQQENQTLDVWENDEGEYILEDLERNIIVYRIDEVTDDDVKGDYYTWTSNDQNVDNKAVDALSNIEKVYDFYLNFLNRHGVLNDESIPLDVYILNDEYHIKNQAQMGLSGTQICVFSENSYISEHENIDFSNIDFQLEFDLENPYALSAYLDIMGHEYTHGIIANEVGNNNYTLSNDTIDEGLADIFGQLIEDYSDGQLDNSCDWIEGPKGLSRDIANPLDGSIELLVSSSTHYLVDINDYDNDDGHVASNLVSYPAYLMTQGINGTEALTNEQLANLYYYMMPNMTASTDFKNFRWLVELQAYIMNIKGELTDSQLESVIDSFDRVGIERNYRYSLTPGSVMTIYDINNKQYSECKVTISKNGQDLYTVEPDRYGDIELGIDLSKGIYKATLEDENSDATYSFYFVINDNSDGQLSDRYESEAKVPTKFSSPEKEVVLALDVSGSMDGTPMSKTKSAALQFVDTIFEVNPNTKINIITYSDLAISTVSSSNDKNEICDTIRNLKSGGGTNMYDAISLSNNMLSEITTDNKYFIIMSDGLPNTGQESGGDYTSPICSLANEMKSDDITICTLGFFHNLEGSELSDGINLMKSVASTGYYFNVIDTSEIKGVFNDIAKQIGGKTSSLIRIACPVDVTVSYNGETLSSAKDTLNTRTSFGTLSFEGDDNEIKILRLDENEDYEIVINGTGKGKMDYSISFADSEGEYTDTRTFEDIPINRKTVICASSSKSDKTMLHADTDGDGKFDLNYIAGKNESYQNYNKYLFTRADIVTGIILAILLAVEIFLIIRRYKRNKYCCICKTQLIRTAKFCKECGYPVKRVRLILPEKIERKPQHKAIKIIKLSVIGMCLILTVGITLIYHSAANTVFLQLRNSEFVSAEMLYKKGVEDSQLQKNYLSFVTDAYLDKVNAVYQENNVDKDFAESVFSKVADMEMGYASDHATAYLENIE